MLHDKPAGAGGIRRHVEDSVAVLRGAGHEVRVLRLGPSQPGDEPTFPQTFDPVSGFRRRSELRRLVSAFAPDLVHIHAGFTALSAVLLRDLAGRHPTVGQFHDVGSFCYHGTRRFMSCDQLCDRQVGFGCWRTGCYRPTGAACILRGIARALIRADLLAAWRGLPRIVVPSFYLRDVALRHGFRPDRMRVIGNFCPPVASEPVPRADPPLILFVGNMLPAKGAHLVLQALAQVMDRPWRAVFAGGGDASALQLHCRELGLADRVRFAGPLGKPDLACLYAESRMLVHASTMPESFGLVGIEAMAHGAPVVGFKLGGVGEWLLDRETGIAVEPWSADALAGGMRLLLEDAALAARLGQAAQARTRDRFSPRQFLADTLTVYGEAMAAPGLAESVMRR